MNKTAWVDIGGHNSHSGFMAQVENGALHTSLKSPLSAHRLKFPYLKIKYLILRW